MNAAVATRDWLEDPVTALADAAVPLYALATVGLWLLARPYVNPRWKLASSSALIATAVALATNQVIAHLWTRPRPFTEHPALTHVLGARTTDPSFPSDHAAAAFAIAFAVLAFSRRAGIGFLAVATLIALSRVLVGVHYPTDVLAGVAVGLVAGLTSARLLLPILDPVLLPWSWHIRTSLRMFASVRLCRCLRNTRRR